ncbi:MAG: ribosome assembly cofactor RimP [Termitinemataceae bacterium]
MIYSHKQEDPLLETLKPVVQGLGMSIVELSVSKQRSGVQVRLTVTKKGVVGIDDCARVHHAIAPRLELAFPDQELSIEVSSPGVDRNIKDASEFQLYIGRGVRCYRTDISDWTAGILEYADDHHVIIRGAKGTVELSYDSIAKAKLDYSQEVED